MCGIAGVFGHPEAVIATASALRAQQHRGQESAGVAVSTGTIIHSHRAMGMVDDALPLDDLLPLYGRHAIGQTRYSTAGDSSLINAQPFVLQETRYGPIAVVHNGTLTNAGELRQQLMEHTAGFTSTSDSEVALHLVAASQAETVREAIIEACRVMQGGFSMLFLTTDRLFAVRDSFGLRPLIIGSMNGLAILDQPIIVASESCVLRSLHAQLIREVAPGELVEIDANRITTIQAIPASVPRASCVFESVYLSRPDSITSYGRSIATERIAMGRQLAKEAPADADIVVPVPDSSKFAAGGYAAQSGLPLVTALVRDIYTHGGPKRSFILPNPDDRRSAIRSKIIPIDDLIRDQRIVMIDDSIIRGTVTSEMVATLRRAGAREVHIRIASPPNRHSCHYGIDTFNRKQLIAATGTIEDVRALIGADSLCYLSLDGMLEAVGAADGHGFCHACFSGHYPAGKPASTIRPKMVLQGA